MKTIFIFLGLCGIALDSYSQLRGDLEPGKFYFSDSRRYFALFQADDKNFVVYYKEDNGAETSTSAEVTSVLSKFKV